MQKEMEELMNYFDEVMDLCIGQIGDMETIIGFDEASLNMMKKSISLYKKSKELSIKMAERMDEHDKKLDKIIRLLEAKK